MWDFEDNQDVGSEAAIQAPGNYCSGFSHEKESAYPGYYQVYLERYKVNAELTSTLRCAYHK